MRKVTITIKDLFDKINQIFSMVKSMYAILNQISVIQKEWLTPKEAALFLSIGESTIHHYRKKRMITSYRPTQGKTFYRKSDLENWIKKGKVESVDESYQKAIKAGQKGRFFKR